MFHGNICWEATRHHAATTSTPAARGAVAQPSLPLAGRPMSPSIRRPPHLMELWVVLGCLARVMVFLKGAGNMNDIVFDGSFMLLVT